MRYYILIIPLIVFALIAKSYSQESKIILDISDEAQVWKLIDEYDHLKKKGGQLMRFSALCKALSYSFKIKSIDDIKVALPLYNKLWKKKEQNSLEGGAFLLCNSIQNELRVRFNEHPDDFEKLDPSLFYPETFVYFAIPMTIEADRVYCELLKKIISGVDGDEKAKKIFVLRKALHFAGTKYSLDFLDYFLNMPGPSLLQLGEEHNRDYFKEISKIVSDIKSNITINEEIGNLQQDNLRYWKTYYLWTRNEFDKIDGLLERKKKEIYQKISGGIMIDLSKELNAEEEEIIRKYRKAEDEFRGTLPILYRERSSEVSIKALLSFAVDRMKPIDFDLVVFFKNAAQQGGGIDDDFMYEWWEDTFQILIEDERGNLRYLLLINSEQNLIMSSFPNIGGVKVLKIENRSGEPKHVVTSKIMPYSQEMKEFFEKYIIPLAPTQSLYDDSGKYIKTIKTNP